MDRRIEGTYTSVDEAVNAVEKLLEEGYVSEEMLLITDENKENRLDDLTAIKVDSIEPDEDTSLWERLKETLSFGNYHSDFSSNPLTSHGVEEAAAEHFNDALINGEIVLLVDSNAPSSIHLSRVNEEALNGSNEGSNNAGNEAIEPIKSSPGEEESYDPSKAQSSREDIEKETETNQDLEQSSSNEFTDNEPQESNGSDAEASNQESSSLSGTPELTGDEETVDTEGYEHVYPENISKGTVEGTPDTEEE